MPNAPSVMAQVSIVKSLLFLFPCCVLWKWVTKSSLSLGLVSYSPIHVVLNSSGEGDFSCLRVIKLLASVSAVCVYIVLWITTLHCYYLLPTLLCFGCGASPRLSVSCWHALFFCCLDTSSLSRAGKLSRFALDQLLEAWFILLEKLRSEYWIECCYSASVDRGRKTLARFNIPWKYLEPGVINFEY